jgi:hypothetical protein
LFVCFSITLLLYLKHQFQRSSCIIFLQKNPYTSFKLTRLEHLNPRRTNPSPRHPRSAVAGGTVPAEPAPSRPRRSRAAAATTHASPSLAPTTSAPGCCGRRRPRRSRVVPADLAQQPPHMPAPTSRPWHPRPAVAGGAVLANPSDIKVPRAALRGTVLLPRGCCRGLTGGRHRLPRGARFRAHPDLLHRRLRPSRAAIAIEGRRWCSRVRTRRHRGRCVFLVCC